MTEPTRPTPDDSESFSEEAMRRRLAEHFGEDEFQQRRQHAAERAHVVQTDLGTYIDDLNDRFGQRIQFPEEDREVTKHLTLFGYLMDAALKAPKEDDKAIRQAIDDELQRCIDTYGIAE